MCMCVCVCVWSRYTTVCPFVVVCVSLSFVLCVVDGSVFSKRRVPALASSLLSIFDCRRSAQGNNNLLIRSSLFRSSCVAKRKEILKYKHEWATGCKACVRD
jgi:hypothetical protein